MSEDATATIDAPRNLPPPEYRFGPNRPSPGRKKGAISPWTTLERAIRRVERAEGIDLAEEFVRKARRNPRVMIALAKKLWPDRVWNEGDRQPTQIIVIDRSPPLPGQTVIRAPHVEANA